MEPKINNDAIPDEELTMEQLKEMVENLTKQNQTLYQHYQNANMNNLFKRLDYLFKVVENGEMFSPAFLTSCVKEIEDMLSIEDRKSETANVN